MITKDEREDIINAAMERILRVLPETIGNMMTAQAMYSKLNKDFYGDNPELINHREIVTKVVQTIEGQDPLKSYEDILKDALPKIKDQIGMKSGLNMVDVPKVEDLNLTINGVI